MQYACNIIHNILYPALIVVIWEVMIHDILMLAVRDNTDR